MVGVTRVIEPKIGPKIGKDLIIKWDPGVDLECLVYKSWVVFVPDLSMIIPRSDFDL